MSWGFWVESVWLTPPSLHFFFLGAMNEVNPALNISDDTIESVIGSFVRLREILLSTSWFPFSIVLRCCRHFHSAGQKYVQIVRFELIRLYEIQHSLRQLSYFDVCGRLRLTLQLARVTLSLPCRIDRAMIEEAEEEERRMAATASSGGRGGSTSKRRGLLHPRVNSVLVSVCGVLEYGERVL